MINELKIITIVNIYLIIGVIVTMLTYETLVKRYRYHIEEDAFIFSSLSTNTVNNIIKYVPISIIIIWPILIIGFVIGFVKGINNSFKGN